MCAEMCAVVTGTGTDASVAIASMKNSGLTFHIVLYKGTRPDPSATAQRDPSAESQSGRLNAQTQVSTDMLLYTYLHAPRPSLDSCRLSVSRVASQPAAAARAGAHGSCPASGQTKISA